MSTFLICLTVVGIAIAGVMWVAMRDEVQPATKKTDSGRGAQVPRLPPTPGPPSARGPAPAPASPPPPLGAAARLPKAAIPVSPVRDRPRTARPVPAARVPRRVAPVTNERSRVKAGFALGVLVTFAGVLVALAISAALVIVATGLRHSVR